MCSPEWRLGPVRVHLTRSARSLEQGVRIRQVLQRLMSDRCTGFQVLNVPSIMSYISDAISGAGTRPLSSVIGSRRGFEMKRRGPDQVFSRDVAGKARRHALTSEYPSRKWRIRRTLCWHLYAPPRSFRPRSALRTSPSSANTRTSAPGWRATRRCFRLFR